MILIFFFYFSYNRNKEKKGKGRNERRDRIFVQRIFEIIYALMYARIYEWLEKSRTTDMRLDAGRSERNDIIGGRVRHWGDDIEF